MGPEYDGEAVPRYRTGLRGGPKLATWAIVARQVGPKLAVRGAVAVITPGAVVAGSTVVAVEA